MKRVLVVGLGTLGRALVKTGWLSDHRVEAASRSSRTDDVPCHALDVSDAPQIRRVFSATKYDLVLNCAAMTDVDGCEKDPEEARRINALAVRDLASACAASGAPLVHISTNYVFSGNSRRPYGEKDLPGPCSVYGMTKLEGEYHALTGSAESVVVRTSWVFGGSKRDFIAYFLERFRSDDALEVVGDQTASLTYAPDLAEAIGRIVERAFWRRGKSEALKPRMYHVANRGSLSRYDMLLEMKKILGKSNRIVKVPQSGFQSWAAVRPVQSALSSDRYERAFGRRLRPWRAALREHLSGEAVPCAS